MTETKGCWNETLPLHAKSDSCGGCCTIKQMLITICVLLLPSSVILTYYSWRGTHASLASLTDNSNGSLGSTTVVWVIFGGSAVCLVMEIVAAIWVGCTAQSANSGASAMALTAAASVRQTTTGEPIKNSAKILAWPLIAGYIFDVLFKFILMGYLTYVGASGFVCGWAPLLWYGEYCVVAWSLSYLYLMDAVIVLSVVTSGYLISSGLGQIFGALSCCCEACGALLGAFR